MDNNRRQIPIAVGLVLNEEGELLIARRQNTQDIPDSNDKWELVGGKVEWGEDPEITVVREVKEESGLSVSVERLLPKVFVNRWRRTNGEEIEVFILSYLCNVQEGNLPAEPMDHKIAELKFIEPKEIYNYKTLPNVVEAVERFLLNS